MKALVITRKNRVPAGIAQAITASRLTPHIISPSLDTIDNAIEIIEEAVVNEKPVVIFIDGNYGEKDRHVFKETGHLPFKQFLVRAYNSKLEAESLRILNAASIAVVGHTSELGGLGIGIFFFAEKPGDGLIAYLKHLGAAKVCPHLTTTSETTKSFIEIAEGAKQLATGVASVASSVGKSLSGLAGRIAKNFPTGSVANQADQKPDSSRPKDPPQPQP